MSAFWAVIECWVALLASGSGTVGWCTYFTLLVGILFIRCHKPEFMNPFLIFYVFFYLMTNLIVNTADLLWNK